MEMLLCQVQFLGHVLRHLIGRVFSMLYALQVLCRKAADVVAVVHVEAPVVDDLGVGVLADKQEEERRAEMERQNRLTSHKPASSRDDDGPSFSP